MSPDGDDAWRLDLSAANAQQLAAAGVQAIEQAKLCTSCHNDEFFSHRADRGQTGRFAVMAYLPTPAHTSRKGTGAAQKISPKPIKPENRPEETDSLHPPGFPPFGEPPGGGA